MNTGYPLLTLALLVLSSGIAFSQEFNSMPVNEPQQHVSGTIRIRGDEHQSVILKNWEQTFRKYQPDIIFDDHLTSTVHGIPALVFNVAGLGLLGREIVPLENLSFRRMFKYDPLEITIATGSYDTLYQAFALGVFVNKENPLSHLTLPQVAAIFGCGPGRNIRTWGQLGLTGEWADQRIHVLGYPSGNNIATFFELKVFQSPPSGGLPASFGGMGCSSPKFPASGKFLQSSMSFKSSLQIRRRLVMQKVEQRGNPPLDAKEAASVLKMNSRTLVGVERSAARILQPSARGAGITKRVGWHTFRHTYSTLLKANGEDVKVVQELMRHANIATTMNIYTRALTPAKRQAQSKAVDVLFNRTPQQVTVQ